MNPTVPVSADDPRLTAYALGALDAAEAAVVEATVTADPALRAAVDALRADAAHWTDALAQEGRGLTALQRQAILALGEPRPARRRGRWTPFAIGVAAAAGLVLAFGLRASSSGAPRVMRDEVVIDSMRASARGGPPPAPPVAPPPTTLSGTASPGRATRLLAGDGAWRLRARADRSQAQVRQFSPSISPLDFHTRVPSLGLPRDAQAKLDDGTRGVAPTFEGVEESVELLPARTHWERVPCSPADVAAGKTECYALVTTPETAGGESYTLLEESGFLRVANAPLSTFSVDVDTASYANVRRMLVAGQRPPPASVRIEELLNYFPYAYAPPTGPDPFAVHLEVAQCPWDVHHRIVRVGIKGREVARKARPPMNLVFLVDVSGSMDAPNKLPLVQASMRMLLEELNERDSVAIVVYAGASGLALAPTWCEQKAVIQKAIDDLRPGGSTNGAAGITLAYETAMQRFTPDGVNRVVLATDGDFNVGVTSHDDLLALITAKAKSGVFLTCLGYGMGNLKDATLELLADKGNGNYGYVDSTREARKVLVEGASGTLVTIAKDVKLQVEFNPAQVAAYRLIGYDDRRLADRDFADDTKDAGEVGAGHTVTALYEVVPVGAPDAGTPAANEGEEPLRYGRTATTPPLPTGPDAGSAVGGELLTVKVRWKEPTGAVSTKREHPLTDGGANYAAASRDLKFACAVASFAMQLRGSRFAGNATLDAVAEWAGEGLSFDPGGYRAEFVDLVAKARALPK